MATCTGLKFRIQKVEGLYYPCSEKKALISFAVTAKLICVFVFAFTKTRLSHDDVHMDPTSSPILYSKPIKISSIFALNVDFGYVLESTQCSNESIF